MSNTPTPFTRGRRLRRQWSLLAIAAIGLNSPLLAIAPAHAAGADTPILSSSASQTAPHVVAGTVFNDINNPYSFKGAADPGIAGARVYGYWQDDDGTLSPTYYTTTDANGNYALLFPDWTDANGTVHSFNANGNEHIRLWMDPVAGYHTSFIDGKNQLSDSATRDQALWDIAAQNVSNFTFALQADVPASNHLPADQQVLSPVVAPQATGTVNGKVFLDNFSTLGWQAFPVDDGVADPGLGGIKVTASYKDAAGNIVETRYTYTRPDGTYSIQFADQGGWNRANMFVSVDLPNGSQYATPFMDNQYMNGAFTPVGVLGVGHTVYGTDFAVKSSMTFDVVGYDTTTNPAPAGTTVHTSTTTIDMVDTAPYSIVWTDPAGNVVKSCTNLVLDAAGNLPSCDFTVPATLAADTIYKATLYAPDGVTALQADSFMALK